MKHYLQHAAPADLELISVTKRYGTITAVDTVDLFVPAGSYTTVLGPSGCGKTSILRMVGGHESVSAGLVRVGGETVNDWPPARRPTAMVFQDRALFPHLNCLDNVAFALKMRGVSKVRRREAAREMLARVQVESQALRMPAALSGGEQQRVALARALIMHPRILLLDEPLAALDSVLRIQLRDELRRLQAELRISFVHVTHDQEEAMSLADRVVVMNAGRIEQVGSPHDLRERPHTAFVEHFLRAADSEMVNAAGTLGRDSILGNEGR